MRSMLSTFPSEKLILHKKDGTIAEVMALVSVNRILIDDVSVIIEEGETFERTLPNNAKEYFRVTDRGFIKGTISIPDHYQCRVERVTGPSITKEMHNTTQDKPHKLFISHSSKDKAYMKALTEMLEDIGMPDESFVCTSIPGHGIPGGTKIFDWLRDQFLSCHLRVLFALSHNYYESAPCLNEMGAAWVTKATDTLLLLPGFSTNDIKGCIDSQKMGICFSTSDDELKHRLNEFKDTLLYEHKLPNITQARWERHRDKFIAAVRNVAEEELEESKKPAQDNLHTEDNPELKSIEALVVLAYAAESTGSISVANSVTGKSFVVGNKYPLKKDDSPREIAKWEQVVVDLEHEKLIKLENKNKGNSLYKVTDKGYHCSDMFRSQYEIDTSISPGETIEKIRKIQA